jgi:hypothetical protein
LSGASDPELPLSEIEPGMYSKLDAEMSYYKDIGYSIFFYGLYTSITDHTEKLGVEYSYSQSEDFRLDHPNGLYIVADQINNILVQIDLVDLFKGVDLSSAAVDEDGIIRLNKESNRDLADIIESNLEAASKLGLDQDEDGKIDF